MRVRPGLVTVVLLLGALIAPSSLSAQTAPTVRPTQQELSTARSAGKDWIT